MDNLLMQLLLFFLVTIVFPVNMIMSPLAAATAADDHAIHCPISNCSHKDGGPVIMFPFRLKDDPPHCGHPEFEVSCFKSMTMIQLSSSSGLFPIQNIDYNSNTFRVYDGDADGCLPRRLLNFTISTSSLFQPIPSQIPNLGYQLLISDLPSPNSVMVHNCSVYHPSDSPEEPFNPHIDINLKYYPQFIKLSLLNCSTDQNFSTQRFLDYIPITCLSVFGHQVLAVPLSTSITDLPVQSCGTLSVTQSYLPLRRVDDNLGYHCEPDNVLLLKWESWENFPQCQNCTRGRPSCEFNSNSNQMECYPYPAIPEPPHVQQHSKGRVSTRYIITGVSLASFILLLATAVAIFFYVQQSKSIEEKENQMKVERFLNDHKSYVPTRYSYADIKNMTNGFKKKLGEGGFGSVFSGKLPNGVPVAIKVLNDSKGNGDDFVNEVGTIGRIHHVNVVRLLGFSAEGGKRAVIYELMPNRSLEKFILTKDQTCNDNASFDWEKLHNIINGIATGIKYLHQGCDQRILHFDIKPHNILLDHDFNPKISDFGLAKLCSKEDSIISMTAARGGTVGYIAPEVFNGNFGNVSYKSDVYSFGMLVLEIIGARREPSVTSGNEEAYFPELIYNRLAQGQAFDLKLDNDGDAQIAKKLVIVALWCIQWYPVNRPSMKAVVRMLEGASENLIIPPNPFASTSNQTESTTPSS